MGWGHGEPPKKSGRYLVTFISKFTGKPCVGIADRSEYPKGNFVWHDVAGVGNQKIVAWQKLPEPYCEK